MSGATLLLRGSVGGGGAGALTAVVAPSTLYGFNYGLGLAVTVETAIVDISGGVAPYTITWTRTSGSASINVDNQGYDNTTFSSSFTSSASRTSTWKAVVTDAASTSVDSNIITVGLESLAYIPGEIIP